MFPLSPTGKLGKSGLSELRENREEGLRSYLWRLKLIFMVWNECLCFHPQVNIMKLFASVMVFGHEESLEGYNVMRLELS